MFSPFFESLRFLFVFCLEQNSISYQKHSIPGRTRKSYTTGNGLRFLRKKIAAKSKTGKGEEAKKGRENGALCQNLFDLAVKISFKTWQFPGT
jgi:hypothetical protein